MISIAMATYNGGKFLREQMDSIFAQTITDFEIVVCDDGSTDNTCLILEEYAQKDKRVKLFFNRENLGFVRNFEKSISLCKGDYIALSDQDDIWYPNHLEVLLKNINNNMLVCGNSALIDKDGKEISSLKWQQGIDHQFQSCSEIVRTILFNRNWAAGHDMMITRSFIDIALPIPSNIHYHDVWLFLLSSMLESVAYVENPVITIYRQHGNNTSDKHILRRNKILIWLKHLLKSNAFPDRLTLTEALKERLSFLTAEQYALLDEAITYHRRQLHFWGRLQNFVYEMKNRKVIYSIKD